MVGAKADVTQHSDETMPQSDQAANSQFKCDTYVAPNVAVQLGRPN